MHGADSQIASLTTVSSPHHGMKLIDRSLDENELGSIENMHRVFEILGITAKAAEEFSTHNINSFNQVCEDSPSVSYYSIGAKKNGRIINSMLRDGHNLIVNDTMGVQCDGLVQDIEARWGEYLITFENDHLELMGF